MLCSFANFQSVFSVFPLHAGINLFCGKKETRALGYCEIITPSFNLFILPQSFSEMFFELGDGVGRGYDLDFVSKGSDPAEKLRRYIDIRVEFEPVSL